MKINSVKLAMAMARKSVNVTKLAEKSHVSRATISYAKSGKDVSLDVVAKLAVALEIEVKDLLEEPKAS